MTREQEFLLIYLFILLILRAVEIFLISDHEGKFVFKQCCSKLSRDPLCMCCCGYSMSIINKTVVTWWGSFSFACAENSRHSAVGIIFLQLSRDCSLQINSHLLVAIRFCSSAQHCCCCCFGFDVSNI